MEQEVPIWDPDNLPTSWDEAKDRYAKVKYERQYQRGSICLSFINIADDTIKRYWIMVTDIMEITYYKYEDHWYCRIEPNDNYNSPDWIYTYFNGNKLEYQEQSNPMMGLVSLLIGEQDNEYIKDNILSLANYSPKNARKG